MSRHGLPACILAIRLAAFLLGSAVPGRSSPIIERAEARLRDEVHDLFSEVQIPGGSSDPSVQVEIGDDGATRVDLSVRTQDPLTRDQADQVIEDIRHRLGTHLESVYPSLFVSPDGLITLRPPLDFTRKHRTHTASMIPPPRATPSEGFDPLSGLPLSWVKPSTPTTQAPPDAQALALAAGEQRASTFRDRLGTILSKRVPVRTLVVDPAPGDRVRMLLVVRAPSRGEKIDRLRLKNLTHTVKSTVDLVREVRGLSSQSQIVMELTDPETGILTRNLTAHLASPPPGPPDVGLAGLNQVLSVGAAVVSDSQESRPKPDLPSLDDGEDDAESNGTSDAAASLEDEENTRPLRERHDSNARRPPISTMDLHDVPHATPGPRGQASFTTEVRARRLKQGAWHNLSEMRNLDFLETMRFSPTDDFQFSVRYERLRQNFDIITPKQAFSPQGDSVSFGLKLRVSPTFGKRGSFTVGTDFALRSRSDRDLRLLDDLYNQESIWLSVLQGFSPEWNALFTIKRVGVFSNRSYSIYAFGSEHRLHHPLRRFTWELVYRDLSGTIQAPFGEKEGESAHANFGLEIDIAKSGILSLSYPYAFASPRQQGNVAMTWVF